MFQQFYKEFTPALIKDFYSTEKFKLENEKEDAMIKVENGKSLKSKLSFYLGDLIF